MLEQPLFKVIFDKPPALGYRQEVLEAEVGPNEYVLYPPECWAEMSRINAILRELYPDM